MRECDFMLARSDTGAGQPVALIIARLAAMRYGVFFVNLPLSPAAFGHLRLSLVAFQPFALISMDGARKKQRETLM